MPLRIQSKWGKIQTRKRQIRTRFTQCNMPYIDSKCEEEAKRKLRYKKIGCFNADEIKTITEILLTDRQLSHDKSSGYKIDWKNFRKSTHR